MTAAADSVEEIDRLIAETHDDLAEITTKVTPLILEQRRLQTRLELLKELRSTYETPPAAQPSVDAASSTGAFGIGAESVSGRVQRQVRELLAEAGRPMKTTELHAAFVERGWRVPGAGIPANLSAHLSHARGIASPRRGYWMLADGEAPRASRNIRSRKSKSKK